MEIRKTKAGLLIQFWSILICLPKRKVNTSTNVSLVKNKRVRYSMLQQILGKNKIVRPQSLGEPECLAKNFYAFFVKKIETVLVSITIANCFILKNSRTVILETFKFLH